MYAVVCGRIVFDRFDNLQLAHLVARQIARSRPTMAATRVIEVATGITL